jgi:hypothetical protein
MDEPVLSFGRWRLLPRTRRLVAGDVPVPPGSRAFDRLLAIIEARGAGDEGRAAAARLARSGS